MTSLCFGALTVPIDAHNMAKAVCPPVLLSHGFKARPVCVQVTRSNLGTHYCICSTRRWRLKLEFSSRNVSSIFHWPCALWPTGWLATSIWSVNCGFNLLLHLPFFFQHIFGKTASTRRQINVYGRERNTLRVYRQTWRSRASGSAAPTARHTSTEAKRLLLVSNPTFRYENWSTMKKKKKATWPCGTYVKKKKRKKLRNKTEPPWETTSNLKYSIVEIRERLSHKQNRHFSSPTKIHRCACRRNLLVLLAVNP